jgi:hypothetical protein
MRNKTTNTILLIIAMFMFLGLTDKLFADTQFDEIKRLEAEHESRESVRIVRPKVEYKAADLNDPFRPQADEVTGNPAEATVTVKLPDLKIQGLVWGAEHSQAIVNGKVFKIGDTVENARIIDINRDGIDIVFEGRQFNIPAPAAVYFQNKKEVTPSPK